MCNLGQIFALTEKPKSPQSKKSICFEQFESILDIFARIQLLVSSFVANQKVYCKVWRFQKSKGVECGLKIPVRIS